MDIGVLFPDNENNFRYFLLLVDVYSSKIFVQPLKSRETEDIVKAVRTIIEDFKARIYEIQADREAGFLSKEFKDFLKKEEIIFRPKFGQNKAAIGNILEFRSNMKAFFHNTEVKCTLSRKP